VGVGIVVSCDGDSEAVDAVFQRHHVTLHCCQAALDADIRPRQELHRVLEAGKIAAQGCEFLMHLVAEAAEQFLCMIERFAGYALLQQGTSQ
jgi:hypothetical protein